MDDALLNTTVRRILMSDKHDLITFDTDEGPLSYETFGDCCSETWIESVEGVDNLIGQTVLAVNDLDLSARPDMNPEDHDSLQIYGYEIVTIKGSTIIDFRNDSNGYYGGSLDRTMSFIDLNTLKEIKGNEQA